MAYTQASIVRRAGHLSRGAVRALLGLALLGGPNGARGQRPFTPQDFLRLRTPSGVALSPDGSRVAYVVEERDAERDLVRSTIYVVPAAGGTSRRLAEGRAPAWSPDGAQLAFLGPGAADARLWRLAASAGTPRPVTPADVEVAAFLWAPDGRSVAAVLSASRPGAPATPRGPASLAVIDLGTGRRARSPSGTLSRPTPRGRPTGRRSPSPPAATFT